MKQVLLRQGGVTVEEVPSPGVEPNRILVRVHYSCISVGTEMSGVRSSSQPLWKRALRKPADVRKVLERIKATGLRETRDLVQRKIAELRPVGYSAAGRIVGIGEGVRGFAVGDLVACAGTNWASHAQFVSVPENMTIPVPGGVNTKVASTVTLGAIALQGIRRANPTLGETFLVVGLGLLGQLTQRMLRANGIHVIGLDLKTERLVQAQTGGLDHALNGGDSADTIESAFRLTDGHGVDGVIITAASTSSDILSTAFRCCRKKGRVVLVGDVGLNIAREDIYAKELDFLVSTSYGPGRYDRKYEEEGIDYPIGYVRWTETRNMQAYLDLIATGRIAVDDLISSVHRIEDASAAYDALAAPGNPPLLSLLDHGDEENVAAALRTMPNTSARPARSGAVRLGVIGAGGFAAGTLLPIVAQHPDRFTLAAVVARQGASALSVTRQFGAQTASTDIDATLADPDIDAVMITTRHDQHGTQVLRALQAGKHVFVEKPLCLTKEELERIEAFYEAKTDGTAPLLMTGFNRRFSPSAEALRNRLATRQAPMMIDYRVNAGQIPADHWVHGPEGGGRNRGEACHFYDFFLSMTQAEVHTVNAVALRPGTGHYQRSDNFSAQIGFTDGSVASLTYTALGDRAEPKERIEVFCDGRIFHIEDFRSFTASDQKGNLSSARIQKGHEEELLAFADAIRLGSAWPIPLAQQIAATRIALAVEAAIGN